MLKQSRKSSSFWSPTVFLQVLLSSVLMSSVVPTTAIAKNTSATVIMPKLLLCTNMRVSRCVTTSDHH